MQFLRIGSAGLRGKVGSGINPIIAIDFVSAFATYLDGGFVIVGRDSRFSSPMLYHAAVSSLLSCGCDVLDAGICPAPLLQFLVRHKGASGGLLVGAGHHPADWNAIVPIGSNGAYLNSIRTQELLDIYHNRRYALRSWDRVGKLLALGEEISDEYLDLLASLVDESAIRRQKFRVVADFCNGSGSRLGPALAQRLGIEMIPINDNFSGVLPHDPEPRPRSSVQVKSIMRYLKASAGFVFDSDMSRAALVSDSGETLSEEYSFPLALLSILRRAPEDSLIISNLCSTRTIDETVARHGCRLLKTKVGQAFAVDKMFETGALAAGDGSGSIAASNAVAGYDAFLEMILILDAMAAKNATLSELVDEMPRYHIIKKKVNCPSSHAYGLIRKLRTHFKGAVLSEEDGLRFDWPDGWIHLRAAMTEPIIRLIVEWKTKDEAEERASELRTIIERLVES